MKKKYRFLSGLLALSLLLGGCGGEAAVSSNGGESGGEAAAEAKKTRYYAGDAVIFGTTAYVPLAEKEILTVQNVSEVKATADGKNMLLVTPSGEIYASDAERQKEVCLGVGTLHKNYTTEDKFILLNLNNESVTYYFEGAISRYVFGSDAPTVLARGKATLAVMARESVVHLVDEERQMTVSYFVAENGDLLWLCETPPKNIWDTIDYLSISIREIRRKEETYFLCTTIDRNYILGLRDGKPYEVCQLSEGETTWTYMGTKDDDVAVLFQTPYERGPGTDVFTLNLKTGELSHLFHTEQGFYSYYKTEDGFYTHAMDFEQGTGKMVLQHWDGTQETLEGLPDGYFMAAFPNDVYRLTDENDGNHLVQLDGSTVVKDTILPYIFGGSSNVIVKRLDRTEHVIVTDGMFNYLVPLDGPEMYDIGETVTMKLEWETIRDELIFLDVYNGCTSLGGDGRGLYMLNVENIKDPNPSADPETIVSQGTLICDNYVPGSLQTNQWPESENALWLQRYDANGMKELCFWDGSRMTVMASEAN